ncbi:MAG TPA: MerR family transcriptional regulator [Stellaceae bacterium]|nr:MerR family transcriptional regulator [Stellaceae bacterium]
MSETGEPAPSRPGKSASAFRTIGEVAVDLDLPQHVLRFWESKFPQLKPLKRGGGRRYYRPEDIILLRRIQQCIYQEGYTIRGVQKLLQEDGVGLTGGAAMSERGYTAAPTLFPLDPLPMPMPVAASDEPKAPAKPVRRPRPRPAQADDKEAIEEIKNELLEIRRLLDELQRGGKRS